MTENLQEIIKWVESNPLIVTLTSGGAIVWLFANLRSIFSAIVNATTACISFTITNTYEDSRGYGVGYNIKMKQMAFNNLLANTKALWERTVNIDLSNKIDISRFTHDCNATDTYESDLIYDYGGMGMQGTTGMTNTYGFSIRLMFKKICFVHRSYKLDGQRITMNTDVRVFFASKKKFMKRLEDEINERVAKSLASNGIGEYVNIFNNEGGVGKKMKRSLSSIFTKDNAHIELYNSIKNFIDNKDIYKKLNYPYNYCGLLYGVPGSGKTSTILAIASELKRDIQYINLSQTNTMQLIKALNDNPSGAIYVFEDIDAISYKGASIRKDDDNDEPKEDSISKAFSISLSDLLNVTDGLLASDGTICLFTTNHIEKLDPAFLRAGRMNKMVEFKYMVPDVARKMIETYLDASITEEIKDNIKPAELQECILDVLLGKATIDDLKSNFCIV